MKIRNRLVQGLWVALVVVVSKADLTAKPQSLLNLGEITQQLSALPNAEVPAKVASLVVAAQGEDREQAARLIIGTAVDLFPASAPVIVSSACKLSPDIASVIVAAGVAKQPKQLTTLARAAALAAPGRALSILSTLCKSEPTQYREIAIAVAQAVPGMDRSIISTVTESLPSLKVFLSRSTELLTREKGSLATVERVLEQIGRDMGNTAASLKTPVPTVLATGLSPSQLAMLPPPPPLVQPTLRPPFQPLAKKPTEFNVTRVCPVHDGRNYSKPY